MTFVHPFFMEVTKLLVKNSYLLANWISFFILLYYNYLTKKVIGDCLGGLKIERIFE
ncbi:hypothetical protein A5889_002777 [Enterococcus sp. 9D6_DIV0238]|uniref:Uncharacterized protein n=2 Tax=Enterococcus TaxID=1350 RepID=A0A200JBT8_9ENTE|nr:hypothetical protein A5889_000171 [Enterococcus sp. 9D6_DIV0238]